MSLREELELQISSAESHAFAVASGDYNPLHVDELAARRTQFGVTVVHGIHAVLKTLDALADRSLLALVPPDVLAVTFNNPIRTGAQFQVRVHESRDNRTRITTFSDDRPAFTLNVTTGVGKDAPSNAASLLRSAPRGVPRDVAFPPQQPRGEVPLAVDLSLLAELFPALAATGHFGWIADLLATTRIVGMECPGLHSIYSAFKLKAAEHRAGEPAAMSYEVEKLDDRFRLARLRVAGVHFEGSLDTFFRPSPVRQSSLAAVAGEVDRGAFAAQKALVIGGSRGVGEVVAKILLCGGADVTLTYARGQEEAEAIRLEAEAANLRCSVRQLDVSVPMDDATTAWLGSAGYSHVYFLASPRIHKNSTGRWSAQVFESLCSIYVHAFARLAAAIGRQQPGGQHPVRWFYASSTFLDTQEPGFAEYCAAKAAGEALARHLASTSEILVATPRLPRMRTDQTSSLADAGTLDPLPVMLAALREFAR